MSSHHQNDGDCAVFVDPYTRLDFRRRIVGIIASLLALFSLIASHYAPVPYSRYLLLCALICFCVHFWLMFLAMFGHRSADEFPHIVVNRDGIHFKSMRGEQGDMIAWSRINSVDRDESALILSFEPEDLASNDPKKRISKMRIAMDEQRRAGLPAAIERFRKSAMRQC